MKYPVRCMGRLGVLPSILFLAPHELDDLILNGLFCIEETGLYPPDVPSRFIVARKL